MAKINVWKPILEGKKREKAINSVLQIVESTKKYLKTCKENDSSVAKRYAGVALLFHYLKKSNSDQIFGTDIEIFLEKAISELYTFEKNDHSLYFGPIGIMWAQNHIGYYSQYEATKYRGYQDLFFLDMIGEVDFKHNFDVMTGMIGLGIYGLQRYREAHLNELLPALVKLIEKISVSTSHGHTWESLTPSKGKIKSAKEWHYNLGLAHGSPCVISFLSAVYAKGIEKKLTGRLLNEAVRWLLWVDKENRGRGLPSTFTNSVRKATE